MKKTLKNKPTRNATHSVAGGLKIPIFQANFGLTIIVTASFLANILNPTLAQAVAISNLAPFSLNDSTTTVNTTPASVNTGKDYGLTLKGATLSEAPEAKIFKSLPAPSKVVSGLITVYSSTPEQTDDTPFIGASGKHVYDGMIAVNGYPFGTKIKIPALYGDKIFTVDDRMNRRYGNKNFDIWMDAPLSELRKLGARRAQVEIYLPVKELAVK